MSFILDALKKSEAERQRQAGPALMQTRIARPRRGVPVWLVIALALLVITNLVGMLWYFLRPQTPDPAPAGGAVPAATVAPAPAAAPQPAAPAATPATALDPAVQAGADQLLDSGLAAAVLGAVGGQRTEEGSDARSQHLPRYGAPGSDAPPLRLDLHVYSPNAAERYAMINMRKVKEGEPVEANVRVVEITRSGVVLLYRGEELLLDRQ